MQNYYNKDLGSRPQWEIVNGSLLGSLYSCVNHYAAYKTSLLRGAPSKTKDYYDWTNYLLETVLKVIAHFDLEKEEAYTKNKDKVMKFINNPNDVTDQDKIELTILMVRYFYKLGLTKVEVDPSKKISLFGNP